MMTRDPFDLLKKKRNSPLLGLNMVKLRYLLVFRSKVPRDLINRSTDSKSFLPCVSSQRSLIRPSNFSF
jgi:hypothetical protein